MKVTDTATVGNNTTETWGKANTLVGDSGLSTSLIGIRGTEDLGGGLKANFVAEWNYASSNGVFATGAAGRNNTLGLSGGFGEVRLGRSYTPLFTVVGMSDAFGATGATTVNLFPDGVRASNAVFYATPNMGGFTVNAMVANNNVSTDAGTNIGRHHGLNVTYASGPLSVGLGYGQVKGIVGVGAGKVNSKNNGTALSATYDLGTAKLFFGHVRSKGQPDTGVATYGTDQETNLGVSVPMGAVTLLAAYGRNSGKSVTAGVNGHGQDRGSDFVVGATYALSKRTTAYFKTGTYNKTRWTHTDMANVSATTKTNRTSVGLRHVF